MSRRFPLPPVTSVSIVERVDDVVPPIRSILTGPAVEFHEMVKGFLTSTLYSVQVRNAAELSQLSDATGSNSWDRF